MTDETATLLIDGDDSGDAIITKVFSGTTRTHLWC
jgi:hypothetical protein